MQVISEEKKASIGTGSNGGGSEGGMGGLDGGDDGGVDGGGADGGNDGGGGSSGGGGDGGGVCTNTTAPCRADSVHRPRSNSSSPRRRRLRPP
jgi:hypothetical protein